MTSRERFRATMAHESPDRVPIDLAATSLTGMSAGCRTRLAEFLGFAGSDGEIEERILGWAGTDFRSVGGVLQYPGPHAKRLSESEYVDCWGVHRRRAGQYWDIVSSPLEGASVEDLAAYCWPEPRIDDEALSDLRREAKRLHDETEYVVIGQHPVLGVLELGCWMCGYGWFLEMTINNPDFVRAFFDRYLKFQLAVVAQYYDAIGEYVDLTLSGDDFGMQTGPLMSPDMFRDLVAPYFSERIRRTKEIADCYYWHHSCGSVVALLDEIIACGVDILNPIQTSAAGMVPGALKERFGDRIVFWGAVDVQDFLRISTPDAVETVVADIIRTLGRSGGYVLSPAHNIQDDVPPENIVAMIETARQGETS